jgi:hypothetical protein
MSNWKAGRMQPAQIIGVCIDIYNRTGASGSFYGLNAPRCYFAAVPKSDNSWDVAFRTGYAPKSGDKEAVIKLISDTLRGPSDLGPIMLLDAYVMGFLRIEELELNLRGDIISLRAKIVNPHYFEEKSEKGSSDKEVPYGRIFCSNNRFRINLPLTAIESNPQGLKAEKICYRKAIERATQRGNAPLKPWIDWDYSCFEVIKSVIEPQG